MHRAAIFLLLGDCRCVDCCDSVWGWERKKKSNRTRVPTSECHRGYQLNLYFFFSVLDTTKNRRSQQYVVIEMSCGCQSRQKLLLLKCATDDAGRRMWSYDIDSYITFLFHVTGEDINFELEINGFLLVEVTLKRTPEWTGCYCVRSRNCEFERFLFSRKHSSLFGSIHGSTHTHAQRIWVRVMCVEWRACVWREMAQTSVAGSLSAGFAIPCHLAVIAVVQHSQRAQTL